MFKLLTNRKVKKELPEWGEDGGLEVLHSTKDQDQWEDGRERDGNVGR